MSPEDSDINHGAYERTACIVFCTITPIFVIARCWSRISSKQFGLDDWAAVVGSVSIAPIEGRSVLTYLPVQVFVLSCNIQTLVGKFFYRTEQALQLLTFSSSRIWMGPSCYPSDS